MSRFVQRWRQGDFFNVRALIATILTVTLVILWLFEKPVPDALLVLATFAIVDYFRMATGAHEHSAQAASPSNELPLAEPYIPEHVRSGEGSVR